MTGRTYSKYTVTLDRDNAALVGFVDTGFEGMMPRQWRRRVLLVAKGQETTQSVRRHLQNYQANDQIGDTVNVWCQAD